MPVAIAMVRLDAARDHVVVTEDLVLGRRDSEAVELPLFVAFGAPGMPRAFDAHIAIADAEGDRYPGTAIVPLGVERAFRAPAGASVLLGPRAMAGAVVRIPASTFAWATGTSGLAWLRLRTLLDLPPRDASGGHEVVIRLGDVGAEPHALGAIEVASEGQSAWVTRALAHLCGPDADPSPLAVDLSPRADSPLARAPSPAALAPLLSTRHASDDLCLRFWTTSDP
jgi:hypothetical protein